jgi:hypothetical protein
MSGPVLSQSLTERKWKKKMGAKACLVTSYSLHFLFLHLCSDCVDCTLVVSTDGVLALWFTHSGGQQSNQNIHYQLLPGGCYCWKYMCLYVMNDMITRVCSEVVTIINERQGKSPYKCKKMKH